MIVRSPRSSEEVAAAADVAEAAFGPGEDGPGSARAKYAILERRHGREIFLVAEEAGRFVSSLMCIPAPVWLGDRRLHLGAVGGVATLPEARRQGHAGALMRAVVRRMREQGLALSALWPFSFAYYRKFGWDYAAECRSYRFEPAALGPLPAPDGVSPITEADLPALMATYEAYAHRLAFCTDRTEDWWRWLLDKKGVAPFAAPQRARTRMLVCREGSHVAGYAVYVPPAGEDRCLDVSELVALTPEARLRLIAALTAEDPSAIRVGAPGGDLFRAQLRDPRAVTVTAVPGFSFRVVDPVAALSALPVAPALQGEIAFVLADPAHPEEPLCAVAACAEGAAEARAVTPSDAARARLRLEMDVPTFSQLFAGGLRPGDAHTLGRVRGDSESLAIAERLFPCWIAYRSALEPG